jgi:uroporphyrinogen-III synthase
MTADQRAGPLILVTRPAADAVHTVDRLAERGFQAIVDPMLVITNTPNIDLAVHLTGAQVNGSQSNAVQSNPVQSNAVQAILITSANGVRALMAAADEDILRQIKSVRLLAVGAASAAAASDAGFTNISHADGDVGALADLVRSVCDPGAGPLVHIAGTKIASDLAGALARAGYQVDRLALYDAVPATVLGPATLDGFRSDKIAAATFYSPRSAAVFRGLAEQAALIPYLSAAACICLSDAVKIELEDLGFGSIAVAQHPSETALIDTLHKTVSPTQID